MAKYDLVEGQYDITGRRFAIVAARFNHAVVNKLIDGARETLSRHGVADNDIDLIMVPGAFEIPLAAQRAALALQVDAIITLGAVIRGGTPHFEYVAGQVAEGVSTVSLEQNLPVIFGVLTTDNNQQALDRSGGSEGNKGNEAAIAALEMVTLLDRLNA